MGLLLLLTCMLLTSCFHPWREANAQQWFMIKDITLSIEPSTEVTRNTTVTLRCRATVSSSGQQMLNRQYIIYKDRDIIYTKTSSSSEDLLYHLPKARVSDIGDYKCQINIGDKQMTSQAKKLTVTGLSKPELYLDKYGVSEGEKVTAWCTAPGETGNLFFYFFQDDKQVFTISVKNSSQAEATLHFSSAGIHNMKCSYTVLIQPDSFKSVGSNTVSVSVRELQVTVVLKIVHQNKTEQNKIYEGDQLDISCTINNSMHNSGNSELLLTQGDKILGVGSTRISHSKVALAEDSKQFECTLEMGNIRKVDTKMVSVTELFSVPTLTMSPVEVFQRENMKLTCKSETFASERIRKEELTYSLYPPESPLFPRTPGEFHGKALPTEFNYTCIAQAKGIEKYSQTLTVRPKVSVSSPRISVVGKVILGQPFRILCQSDSGSLPINYTLLKDYSILNTTTVELPSQQAFFTTTITKTDEINQFMCEAINNRNGQLSRNLYALVIEPLSNLTMTVIPNITEISEGNHLFLICGARGSPPVTFKWYRKDSEHPLHVTTSNQNNSNYQVASLSKEHSGTYYCEAINSANTIHSDPVIIEVRMALWKKALIGGACLLLVAVVVLVAAVLYFRSKRGKREAAAELSVKPSSPKSDDSLTVNLTHDTEVYNADKVRVDSATVSVWSKRPPEADDEESSVVVSNESDVEYTEVVHPRSMEPARVPLRKGTDTVYSELQNSPHGDVDHHNYGSVEYAELHGEQPEINHYHPEVNNYQDLPEPVD